MRPPESVRHKFVCFQIAGYQLALPLEGVLRVIQRPETARSPELHHMGLLPIGHHLIKVIDLQARLAIASMDWDESSKPALDPFLMIVRSSTGEYGAIPIQTPPDLIEVKLEDLRSLPSALADSALLTMASHIIITPDQPERVIVLLDLQRLCSILEPATLSLPAGSSDNAVDSEGTDWDNPHDRVLPYQLPGSLSLESET